MSKSTPPSLLARSSPLASPATQRETLHALPLPREFDEALRQADLHPLKPTRLDIFQLNLGKMCNQTCRHCHVDAGPDRREVMSRETMEQCLAALAKTSIPTVDLTGGAPEMNPHFRWLVEELRKLGRHVMDRCNLTILETKPHYELPAFLAEHRVEVVCSLPHYRALNTDKQRGEGVYEQSIRALQRLNALGYGDGTSGLRLVLVTNPVGAFLPANQASMEAEWKRELLRNHGIRFDSLYALTN
ncbi:MAG TPA: radical SAM protein, partial [Myxococcaceae bacterium]|nr:radical SAM protein [Myxococcaceae bacterium]